MSELYFRGKPACECLVKWLAVYEAELLRRGLIRFSLDVYQLIGGYSKSGGTHLPGGAFDLGQTTPQAIMVGREMGAAQWHRPAGWDGATGISHSHGVLRGCAHNDGGRYQITAMDGGYNGLGSGGRGGIDPHPRPSKVRTWSDGVRWALEVQAKARKAGAAPVLADLLRLARSEEPGILAVRKQVWRTRRGLPKSVGPRKVRTRKVGRVLYVFLDGTDAIWNLSGANRSSAEALIKTASLC